MLAMQLSVVLVCQVVCFFFLFGRGEGYLELGRRGQQEAVHFVVILSLKAVIFFTDHLTFTYRCSIAISLCFFSLSDMYFEVVFPMFFIETNKNIYTKNTIHKPMSVNLHLHLSHFFYGEILTHVSLFFSKKCGKDAGEWLYKRAYILLNRRGLGRSKEGFRED